MKIIENNSYLVENLITPLKGTIEISKISAKKFIKIKPKEKNLIAKNANIVYPNNFSILNVDIIADTIFYYNKSQFKNCRFIKSEPI